MGHLFFGGWIVYGRFVKMALNYAYGKPEPPKAAEESTAVPKPAAEKKTD